MIVEKYLFTIIGWGTETLAELSTDEMILPRIKQQILLNYLPPHACIESCQHRLQPYPARFLVKFLKTNRFCIWNRWHSIHRAVQSICKRRLENRIEPQKHSTAVQLLFKAKCLLPFFIHETAIFIPIRLQTKFSMKLRFFLLIQQTWYDC